MPDARRPPLFRVPPFPGRKISDFSFVQVNADRTADIDDLLNSMRRWRVGGSYWAAQPQLPLTYVLVRCAAALEAAEQFSTGCPVVLWQESCLSDAAEIKPSVVVGLCDPWHMLAGAAALVLHPDDELGVISSVLGVPTYLYDPATGSLDEQTADARQLVRDAVAEAIYFNPFTGESMTASEAVELCGFWRQLIDANRGIAAGVGFAFWKQDNVSTLLWGGSKSIHFMRTVPETLGKGAIALWRSKVSAETVSALEKSGVPLVEVEDGFLRSQGLGADCVPPLSITVDWLGAYFDPAQPSELERLLQEGEFDEQIISRARRLRQMIVDAGLGKYERARAVLERPAGNCRHILVPGQVEDDRSVQTGGSGLTSNLDLLKRVRKDSPDAYILYKPHPDVLAGHRSGAISDRLCLEYADQVATDLPISSLIDMVDEVHVNTSLAGFEALLRDKRVTTHGVPFYAGWGLTRDLGPVPSRRTAIRTVDELVAATLLLYPRYLDPVTGLPCPAEVVVDRLCAGAAPDTSLLVTMRRLQGKLMRRFRRHAQ